MRTAPRLHGAGWGRTAGRKWLASGTPVTGRSRLEITVEGTDGGWSIWATGGCLSLALCGVAAFSLASTAWRCVWTDSPGALQMTARDWLAFQPSCLPSSPTSLAFVLSLSFCCSRLFMFKHVLSCVAASAEWQESGRQQGSQLALPCKSGAPLLPGTEFP